MKTFRRKAPALRLKALRTRTSAFIFKAHNFLANVAVLEETANLKSRKGGAIPMKKHRLTVVVLVRMASAIPAVADVIVGLPADPNTGNCYPFGCAYLGEYQQVYSHTQFSGPITITGLEFFNTAFNFRASAMNSGNWTISLS